ncbi:MAG: hypothetical protein ABIN67_21830 [Ferruginibacter sp.]
MLFKIFWVVDAMTAMVFLYFFFVGLADGTVSARNMGLWFSVLAILGVILFGSTWLRSNNYPSMAMATLLILAIPALLFLIFTLAMIVGKVKWN